MPITIGKIIYLRTTPNVLKKRIEQRGSKEENIVFKYLELIHQLHDDWLMSKNKTLPAPVYVIDGNTTIADT